MTAVRWRRPQADRLLLTVLDGVFDRFPVRLIVATDTVAIDEHRGRAVDAAFHAVKLACLDSLEGATTFHALLELCGVDVQTLCGALKPRVCKGVLSRIQQLSKMASWNSQNLSCSAAHSVPIAAIIDSSPMTMK